MIDTLAIKKYSLRYWVDRSQAARKAAEELAMKEVKPSLRDKYKPEGLVFDLDGKKIEFKGENEKNPDDPKYNFFTYEEAMERFGEPDKDGWRLPTIEEFKTLRLMSMDTFVFGGEGCTIDDRLYLPAEGFRHCADNEYNISDSGTDGYYWSSTPKYEDSQYLHFNMDGMNLFFDSRCYGQSVRLVRNVKESELHRN